MILTVEQWITLLVAIAEIVTGGVLWKLTGERIALQKERADWFKEKAGEAEKLKDENDELKTTVSIALKTQKQKDEAINNLSEMLNLQKKRLAIYKLSVEKLELDLAKVESAQVDRPVQISSATASSTALMSALTGKP